MHEAYDTPEGAHVIPVRSRVQMNSVAALRTAAIAGAGLIHAPFASVSEAVRSGALVCVLDRYVSVELGIYAVYPSGKQASPKVRAFVDYLALTLPRRLAAAAT